MMSSAYPYTPPGSFFTLLVSNQISWLKQEYDETRKSLSNWFCVHPHIKIKIPHEGV
jgi:hypothetical protein